MSAAEAWQTKTESEPIAESRKVASSRNYLTSDEVDRVMCES